MAQTVSGAFWVTWANANAKNSTSVEDLAEPFRSDAKAFIQALTDAGASVHVGTTRRSDKRAYLFHWCWLIGLGMKHAADADTMAGVDIEWDHGDAVQTQKGATEMVDGFGLAVPPSSTEAPALDSNHISGTAIDMDIVWTGTMNIKMKSGTTAAVVFMPDVNSNIKLHAVGASFGVIKLRTDAPHWSLNGH